MSASKRFQILWVVLVIVGLMSFAIPAFAKTKVTMWMGSEPANMAAWYAQFQADFNAANPDLDLEITLEPYVSGMRTKVVVASAAGTGPDVFGEGSNVMSMYVINGLARPLDDYLAKMTDRKDFIDDIFRDMTFSGKTYGFPVRLRPLLNAYNNTVLGNAGIVIPKNWNDMISAVRKITKQKDTGEIDVYGYSNPNSAGITDLEVYLQQQGQTVIEKGAKEAKFDLGAATRAMEYMMDVARFGQPDKKNASVTDFFNGKVGVLHSAAPGHISWNNFLPEGGMPSEVVFGPYVGPTVGTEKIHYMASALMINTTSKNTDAAWRVIQYFASPKVMKSHLLANGLQMAPRKSLFVDKDLVNRPVTKEAMAMFNYPMLPLGNPHEYYSDFRSSAGKFITQGVNGDIPIGTALDEMKRTIDTMLAEKMAAK